ncbi:hypothetical protein [Kumtagia ephedrae]|uniref:Uncharacterized protein n=1 Tax=Kumtagia ephedrae TaxID=2116701 RepID=A0A2P7RXF7_9HYPH|nr:hypothetical protein [Mesorhizobium ephedrae]PSJ54842.1 hypothetical protein C7I84_23830 [Mesorhizobium ephedrae]
MQRCPAIFGSTLGMLLFAALDASEAAQCSKVSYQASKSQLSRYLSGQGYSKPQIQFLMRNAHGQVRVLQSGRLNAQAKECGIDSARAHVLGCTRSMMPGLLKGSNDLDAQKNHVLWGRSKFTVRELLFIGGFYNCLGAAKEAMFR